MAAVTVPQALQLLQLEPGATKKQIRAAYKRLALQLHPDKQHWQRQQQQQQHHALQSSGATDAFTLLSAAYTLLIRDSRSHCSQGTQEQALAPFETAYATGSLFCEQLIDEAVLHGASPADIVNLQQLAAAAAVEGQLAHHLAVTPPTVADEQLWRQLYTRMELRQQARRLQLQHQQQLGEQRKGGVGLGELLSDLLLKPTGPLFVEETDSDCDSDVENSSYDAPVAAVSLQHSLTVQQHLPGARHQQQQQQQLAQAATCCQQQQQAPSILSSLLPPQQQKQLQQQQQVPQASQQLQLQQQDPGQHSVKSEKPTKQLRHGWGFYWLWLRRALLAKAVVSVLSSGLKAKLYEHRFPEPLPLPVAR